MKKFLLMIACATFMCACGGKTSSSQQSADEAKNVEASVESTDVELEDAEEVSTTSSIFDDEDLKEAKKAAEDMKESWKQNPN